MNSLHIIVAFLLYSYFTVDGYCWVATAPYRPEDFAKNNISEADAYCYLSSHGGVKFDKGESKKLENQCVVATCHVDHSIGLTGCGKRLAEPPCFIVNGNPYDPYPQCCDYVNCPSRE